MKSPSLLFIGSLLALATVACTKQEPVFQITPKDNPWPDDYEAVMDLSDSAQWGPYNVHDPSCRKIGDYYYMYSTDAIFGNREHPNVKNDGFIQCRRSRDLVHWEFLGWAFPSIPEEAKQWVQDHATEHKGASNIWAPYITQVGDQFLLYYCVSAFGQKSSYIGLAVSSSPQGPWEQRGCIVKTDASTPMNAIDPTVITDPATGRMWMHYGSYFGGTYCVELSPTTGLPLQEGDKGHLIARRANYTRDNLEAPEIIYNPQRKQYYLFTSYDPLMTTYNVRVGRSDSPQGPFYDFNGKVLSDTTNNLPILTAPYKFANHPGWAGTAHCSVFSDDSSHYYMAHQGRLAPHNLMMDLHVRQVFFTPSGWPVVAPERYAASTPRTFKAADLVGIWEIIRIEEPTNPRRLEAGQIMWGEGALKSVEWNPSKIYRFEPKGFISQNEGIWSFDAERQLLHVTLDNDAITDLIVLAGHDWEQHTETILFTGLDATGHSVWGKRIK